MPRFSEKEEREMIHKARDLFKQEIPASIPEEQARLLITSLREVIHYLDWKYYIEASPVLADFEYDQLFKKLQSLEEAFPHLRTPDSPTQRVARSLTETFANVAHSLPMLSLDNSYNEEDLREWDRKMKELTGKALLEYSAEPKFDGSSIALLYENDLLVRAATRGDGLYGEEITNNVKVMHTIPLRAAFSQYGIQKAEVRGEVVIHRETFVRMNEERSKQGLKPFQNPRNTAAGGLRMKDPSEVAKRGLEAFIYQLGYAVDEEGNNLLLRDLHHHYQNISLLAELGFKTPDEDDLMQLCQGIDEVIDFVNQWEARRDTYGYEIDGMVIKINDIRQQEQAGSTSHHPRWAMAFKFKAKQATSRLLRVEYQVGRTGAVTPVAKLEPVSLAGVTISSVSLHNEDMIREKDIRIGDTVIVERAGDVIPYIAGVIKESRDGREVAVQFPKKCPFCKTTLVKPEDESVWRCINAECPQQSEERLIHFVSKGAMDIEGLGKDIIRKFYQLGLLKTFYDLYQLDYEAIRQLEGWKEKSVNNLRKGIEASKKQPLWRLITGLGIRHVGPTTAKVLTRYIDDILDLQHWSVDQLEDIQDIGPVVAASIHDFFLNPGNIDLIRHLKELGVNTRKLASEGSQGGKLDGKTFLFTGTLTKFSRDKAKELVETHGGKNLSSVSRNLDYLVAGEKAGSKLRKAEAIDSISILTEEEFLAMLEA